MLSPSSFTTAACRPGDSGERWSRIARYAAESQARLPLEAHRYLASHPDPEVRHAWAQRPSKPLSVVDERVLVETDPRTRARLLACTRVRVSTPPDEALRTEGRLALVARAANPACPDAVAAEYLTLALPTRPTRRSAVVHSIAVREAAMWSDRPLALGALLGHSTDRWMLHQLAPLCHASPDLESLLVARALQLGETPRSALGLSLQAVLTPTLEAFLQDTFGSSDDPEVLAALHILKSPVDALPYILSPGTGFSGSHHLRHHLVDVLSNLQDLERVRSCVEWILAHREDTVSYFTEAALRAVLGNPVIDYPLASLLVSQWSYEAESPYSRPVPLPVRRARREAGVKPLHLNSAPSPRTALAHALAEPYGYGPGITVCGQLIAHLTPWLGTEMEETFAGLLHEWSGTLGGAVDAAALLGGVPVPSSLPRPVRRRRTYDEPPF